MTSQNALENVVAKALIERFPEVTTFVRLAFKYGISATDVRGLIVLKYADTPNILNDLLQIVDYLDKERANAPIQG